MKYENGLQIIDQLHSIWPRQELPKQAVDAYIRYLEDLPLEVLMLAIINLAVTEEFLPSIAKLRSTAVALIPGNEIPTADEAWRELPNELRRVGLRRSGDLQPKFSHVAILETADTVGWEALVIHEKPGILQAQFSKIYDSIAERYRQEQLRSPLSRQLLGKISSIELSASDREDGF